jgi:MinD superfamily P-loop ATPase
MSGNKKAPLTIDHDKCTECRLCYAVCREININAVVLDSNSRHLHEIDNRCTYPGCTVCLMYCPAEGSIIETDSGRSLVPPPPEVWTEEKRWPRRA